MPTATPFTALGRGNGFPFCPVELAVRPVDGSLGMSINDYNAAYATWNGGDFQGLSGGLGFSQPFTNLTDSMNFFWNLHSFTLSSSISWVKNSNSDSASVSGIDITQSVEKTPSERACLSFPPSFRDSEAGVNVNFLFAGIYYFGEGGSREYYWGLISTGINPGIGVGSILPRTYENRTDLYEYTPFVLVFDSAVSIAMAYYTTSALTSGSGSASIDSLEFYTYT